jgi:hypothetical protein
MSSTCRIIPCLLFLFACLPTTVLAQEVAALQANWKRPQVSISYFGVNLKNPGGKIGFEKPLATRIKEKEGPTGESKQKIRQWIAAINLGGYHIPKFHTGVFGNVEVGFRNTGHFGLVKEISVGAGALRTYLPGTTYQVEGDQVKEISLAGGFYAMSFVSLGLGYDLQKKIRLPGSVYVKSTWFFYLPVNTTYQENFVLEAGLRYRFSGPIPHG